MLEGGAFVKMTESLVIPAAAPRIWQALTDFQHYEKWHPFVRLEGKAAPRESVKYVFQRHPGARSIITEATISTSESPRLLTFHLGVARLISVAEWYAIEPAGEGERVTHGVRFSGMLAFAARPFLRKLDAAYLARPLQGLARYLAIDKGGGAARPRGRQRRGSSRRSR